MPNGGRHFCATDYGRLVDPNSDPKNGLRVLDPTPWNNFARDHCVRFAGQLEQCPTTGKPHYQIYFQVKGKKEFKQINALLGFKDFELTSCKSAPASWVYCQKPESRIDGGWSLVKGEAPPGQGARSDLLGLKRALDTGGLAGAFDTEFAATVKFHRGAQAYLTTRALQHARVGKTKCWVFTGPAGCGKSSLAHRLAEYFGTRLYVKPCSEKWFDHYDPLIHKAVLLDDFTGWIPYNQLLAIADRGQCFVEVKGGTLPFLAEHLFITSNVSWNKWYDWDKKSPEALKRRIDYEWNGDWEDQIVPINGGAAIDVEAIGQRPKSPVIIGGALAFTPLYKGKGEWEIDDGIEINED